MGFEATSMAFMGTLVYEDEIRRVEGPDAGRGGPEGTPS